MRWEVSNPVSEQTRDDAQAADRESRSAASCEVLVLDRDPELRVFLNKALFASDLSYTSVSSATEALACLRGNAYGAVVVGIDSQDAIQFIQDASGLFPRARLIAVARAATPELVREVLQSGASDFLFGTMDVRTLGARISSFVRSEVPSPEPGPAKVAEKRSPSVAASAKRSEDAAEARSDIVCRNKRMKRVLEIAETIAPTESTVLIQGESGTGKEVIARRIHQLSKRKDKPFVEVNCGALPENLLESQLFGHEKGSFTGAVHRQVGLFEIADGGTIFLDEIGELGLDMQVKLLRVLQFREFRRIGGSQVVRVNVRVIAATNKDLAAEVDKAAFRTDLFYRLNVIALQIPPLRERLEEIPDLVELFAERFAADRGMAQKTFNPAAIERLQKYRWAGNVRELENAVERFLLLSRGEQVEASDIEEHLADSQELVRDDLFAPTLTLDEVKKIHIGNVLSQNQGNKMKTARMLQINVKTLYNLMKRLDIKEP